jgi:hypothetical protein
MNGCTALPQIGQHVGGNSAEETPQEGVKISATRDGIGWMLEEEPGDVDYGEEDNEATITQRLRLNTMRVPTLRAEDEAATQT